MEALINQTNAAPILFDNYNSPADAPMKILIAEDNAVSRRVLESILLMNGFQVVTASNGAEACTALQAPDAPQLAILDLDMPMLNGLEVCKWIRLQPELKQTYVMLLTAKSSLDDLITGLEAGANDYLTKPYNRAELRARIQVGARVLALQRELTASRCPHCGTPREIAQACSA